MFFRFSNAWDKRMERHDFEGILTHVSVPLPQRILQTEHAMRVPRKAGVVSIV